MDQKIYDYYASGTEEKHWWHIARRQILKNFIDCHINFPNDAKILDVGCGTGAEMAFLQQYGEIYGVDTSEEMINVCKNRKLSNSIVVSANNLPFKNEMFDLVTCLDTLEHIEAEKRTIEEIYRVCKNNGHLVLTVPAGQYLFGPYDISAGHYKRYSKRYTTKLLTENGFKIIKASYFNFFLYLPIAFIRILNKYIPINAGSEKALKVPSNAINNILKSIFSLESYLLQHLNFPFGVSLVIIAKK